MCECMNAFPVIISEYMTALLVARFYLYIISVFRKVELQVGKLIRKIDEHEETSWVFLSDRYKKMRCVKMLTRVVCFRVLHPNSTLQVSSQVSLLIQLQPTKLA